MEGIKRLTSVYKQVQDSFAEQIVIYLQTAWRRHKGRMLAKTAAHSFAPQQASARTVTPIEPDEIAPVSEIDDGAHD